MHSSSIDRSKIKIAPALHSIGQMKTFSVSSSFKNIHPVNSFSETYQDNVTDINIIKHSHHEKEKYINECSDTSVSHSSSVPRKLCQKVVTGNSKKVEDMYFLAQKGYEKHATDSKISHKGDILKSAFKIPQINVSEPLKTSLNGLNGLYKNKNTVPVIAPKLSLNSQKSFDPNHNLKGAIESHKEQHDFNNQEESKKHYSADHMVESNQQKYSTCNNSPELLKGGRLKIRSVSEINLLSELKKRTLVAEENMEFLDTPNVNVICPGAFDYRKTCEGQEESKNCIRKDSSLLSLSKVCEKPKFTLLAKPIINTSCVYNVKNNYLNGLAGTNVESDLNKTNNCQQSIRKPLRRNKTLSLCNGKSIIPAKRQISLLAKNNTDSFAPHNELSSVNKEMDDKLNNNSTHNVTKITSIKSVDQFSELVNQKNKEMEQTGSPDIFNHIINNRFSQITPKSIDKHTEIYSRGSSISLPIKNNSFIGNNSNLSRLPGQNMNANIVAMPLNDFNNRQESDIVIKKCLQIAVNSSNQNINNSENRSYLEETGHQKRTVGNTNNNRCKSPILIQQNSFQEEDNFGNLITSLDEQIETVNEHNEEIKQSKKTFETHCETPQSKNKLNFNPSENISIQSNASFPMKDIFSNTGDFESSKDSSPKHTSSKGKGFPSTLQLREDIEQEVNLSTLSLSKEPPEVYKSQKRKMTLSQNVSNKIRYLHSSQTHSKEIQLRGSNKSVDEFSKNNSESGNKTATSLINAQEIYANETFEMKQCKVLLDRKEILRHHFFSSTHGTYLSKFYGFTKNEIKTRKIRYLLRIYNKAVLSVTT